MLQVVEKCIRILAICSVMAHQDMERLFDDCWKQFKDQEERQHETSGEQREKCISSFVEFLPEDVSYEFGCVKEVDGVVVYVELTTKVCAFLFYI